MWDANEDVLDWIDEQMNLDRDACAAEALEAVVQRYPSRCKYWQMYAESLLNLGRFREAKAALTRALQKSSKQGRIHARLGVVCSKMGNPDAEVWFEKACGTRESKIGGWMWTLRGATLFRLGRFDLAEECHRRALALPDCELDETYVNLGVVLTAQRRYAEASRAFKKALEHDAECRAAKEGLRRLDNVSEGRAIAERIRDEES